MIQSIRLTNFKCFEEQEIPLRPLTLLAGLNSSGKSTIIQSFLLLRQSFREGLLPQKGLTLNGEFVQLGTAKDVLFEEADADELGFELVDDSPARLAVRFAYREESNVLEFAASPEYDDGIWMTPLFGDNFQYLRAERIGPRTSFAMSDYEVRHHRRVGSAGEYTAQLLSVFGSENVEALVLRHPGATSTTLQSQAEAWMTEISPGIRLELKPVPEMDLISMSVSYLLGHQVASQGYRPTNVGFGIIYALPVIVSILAARPGSLLIIENPEAHLHPRGQVKIGQLIARAATAGTQVLLETHSDHVLNGIRIAVHHDVTKPASVALYHSAWHAGAKSPVLTRMEIREDGRLSDWPEGFFDEIDKSLDELLGG